jgi:two-component system, OmpR family, phosphate regulon sensor histidine kinase PhoR
MKNTHLRKVIVLGSLVLACLMVLQLYWFKKAFDVSEKQFDHTVQVALKKIADSVSRDAQVKKLSSNFFFVMTNSGLTDHAIDSLIRHEFSLRSLNIDYELGVYKADDDTLVYGSYVPATKQTAFDEAGHAAVHSDVDKNFAVYFPGKKSYLAGQLDVWIFSTAILLLMMGFFTYSIASLLRERKFAELKNDFINNMTHEFKTPVTNIQIASEILKSKISDQNSRLYIDILLKENRKLREKIDGVLLGASFDYRRKPAFETIDVHHLIKDCAESFHLRLKERDGHIQLQFNASSSIVLADRELLAHAISNVIDNAEKYSAKEPRIVLRTCDVADGIEIDIVDCGIGIEPKLRKKVFEKFFRVSAGNIHNVKGFGLGLNFVRDVIQSHRGQVKLISELNKGTEVRIILPKA